MSTIKTKGRNSVPGITLESLGLTTEELQNRVVAGIVERTLNKVDEWDFEYDEGVSSKTKLAMKLNAAVQKRVDAAIAEIAEKHILPNAAEYIENVTFQKTNRWGEAKADPVTFREYLASRAESYLTDQVDMNGRSEQEARSSGSSFYGKNQTRITYMVHQHLHYEIERIMKDALQTANNAIATGIQETVKMKLEEIVKGLKVSVQTK